MEEVERTRLPKALRKRIYTGEGLMQVETPAITWAIDGILPEGLNLLAAKPKVGKSTYANDAGIAIAEGGLFLGKYRTNQGRVLYVSIDDKAINRIQERLRRRLGEKRLPDTFQYAFEWNTIGKDDIGLEEFSEYVRAYPTGEVKLIVVDVLPNILPAYREDAQAYQVMYEFLPALKDFAHDNHLSVLALAHKNKSKATGGDLLDGIYGNVALSAIADNILVIDELPSRQRVLRTKGKDIPEEDLHLNYNRETEQSTVGEPTAQTDTGSTRPTSTATRILRLLAGLPECSDMRARDIYLIMGEEFQIKESASKAALTDLKGRKQVDMEHYEETGRYRRLQTGCAAA